jgi:hypothetical protein
VSRVTYLTPEQEIFVLELASGLVRGDISLDDAWGRILAN